MSKPKTIPRVLGEYWLEEHLGTGSSGSVFKAYHLKKHTRVALKVQRKTLTNAHLDKEKIAYSLLRTCKGIPTLRATGAIGRWKYLAIGLLGPSLESLYQKDTKPIVGFLTDTKPRAIMDLRTVCSIAIQLISRVQSIHDRGVLHRDIHLGNCLVGLPPDEGTIYLIDFAFSNCYEDPKTGQHIPYQQRDQGPFVGNYFFTSKNVHCHLKEPARRDDMEAVALVLIHLLIPGGLPWTIYGDPHANAIMDFVHASKCYTLPEDLCRGIPSEFKDFLQDCRQLKFTASPDYDHWKNTFRQLAQTHGFSNIDRFIWPPPPLPLESTKTSLRLSL
ncbi:kinase-like protein [Leucogyrophana mollusca]|uniref:Kinase-like protein n=1 Tax=Leucogyrophana mollusca TaxID=85980 RepID=A0ACB8BSM5_9AGAM|nr:kinase-like protein [Leucogyrophana mollusca]